MISTFWIDSPQVLSKRYYQDDMDYHAFEHDVKESMSAVVTLEYW